MGVMGSSHAQTVQAQDEYACDQNTPESGFAPVCATDGLPELTFAWLVLFRSVHNRAHTAMRRQECPPPRSFKPRMHVLRFPSLNQEPRCM
mmetsp:Transcript_74285/g.147132  ORF Transcript_74285/g.147132 Transcript_74285/m.147132 type:complete len:91 (+) Transcript_74285:95-367(+)